MRGRLLQSCRPSCPHPPGIHRLPSFSAGINCPPFRPIPAAPQHQSTISHCWVPRPAPGTCENRAWPAFKDPVLCVGRETICKKDQGGGALRDSAQKSRKDGLVGALLPETLETNSVEPWGSHLREQGTPCWLGTQSPGGAGRGPAGGDSAQEHSCEPLWGHSPARV